MKKFFYFIFFIPLFCFGQYNINGRLVSNNNPIANCPLKLIQSDKVINYTLSKEDGSFEFQNVLEGTYTIEINSFFYEFFSKQIFLNSNITLDVISISEKLQNLNEVVVSKQKNPFVYTNSGTLIDVSGSLLKNRKNISSILNYVPNISTINGLKILGSDNILIVLDEKEVKISKDKIISFLNSIPIKSIENIEVIDRVDSSVDSSKSGIIKINTIRKEGQSGSLEQQIYYNNNWGYSNDMGLFYSNEKYRVFSTFSHSRGKLSYEEVNNLNLENQSLLYNSVTEAYLNRKNDNLLLGIDYYITKKSNLSFLYIFDYDIDDNHNRNTHTNISKKSIFDYSLNTKRLFNQTSKDHSISLAFNNTIDTIGSSIKISLDFMNKKYVNPESLEEIHYKIPIIKESNIQNSKSNSFVYVFNTIWNKKFSNNHIFYLGTRFSFVDNKDFFDYFDILNNQQIKNYNFSNDFFLKEYIFSFFTRYLFPIGEKSTISLGTRSEYNYNVFNNRLEHDNNDNSEWLFNIQYNTKLWNNNLYISAINRLNRVNYNLFNPTYVRSSYTSAYVGNKDLKPSNIYQIQVGYTGKINFNFTYRYTKNNILTIPNDINGILTTKPENIGHRNDFYIFTSINHKMYDWWEMNLKLMGGNLNFSIPNKKFNSLYGEVYLIHRFYLPHDIEFGLEYYYVSNHKNLYTKIYYNNYINLDLYIPISKSFKLGISFDDIFNSSRTKSEYYFNNIYDYNFNKDDSREISFSITYEFSKGKKVDENIRKNGVQEEKNRMR